MVEKAVVGIADAFARRFTTNGRAGPPRYWQMRSSHLRSRHRRCPIGSRISELVGSARAGRGLGGLPTWSPARCLPDRVSPGWRSADAEVAAAHVPKSANSNVTRQATSAKARTRGGYRRRVRGLHRVRRVPGTRGGGSSAHGLAGWRLNGQRQTRSHRWSGARDYLPRWRGPHQGRSGGSAAIGRAGRFGGSDPPSSSSQRRPY